MGQTAKLNRQTLEPVFFLETTTMTGATAVFIPGAGA